MFNLNCGCCHQNNRPSCHERRRCWNFCIDFNPCKCQPRHNRCDSWQRCDNDFNFDGNFFNQNMQHDGFSQGGCGASVRPIFFDNSNFGFGNGCSGVTVLNQNSPTV